MKWDFSPNPELFAARVRKAAGTEDIRQCLDCGMNAYIGKPFVLEDIYRRYEEVLTSDEAGRSEI